MGDSGKSKEVVSRILNHEVLADGSSWPSSFHGRFTREEITLVLTRYVAGRAGLDAAEGRTNLLLMLSGIEL